MKYIILAICLLAGGTAYAQDVFPNKSNWTISDGGSGGTIVNMPKLTDVCDQLLQRFPKPPANPATNNQWCASQFRKHTLRWLKKLVLVNSTENASVDTKKAEVSTELCVDSDPDVGCP